jgi:hypothetical protein
VDDEARVAFWQSRSSEMEGRAGAAGHLVQNAATLGVTAVAGGRLAAGLEALQTPVLAVIVALVVWLLALIASLNWAEMKVLARKRDIAEDEVPGKLALGALVRADLPSDNRSYSYLAGKRDLATRARRFLVNERAVPTSVVKLQDYWKQGKASPSLR